MNDKIIIEVDFEEALAIRTGLSLSKYDISEDIQKVTKNIVQGTPLLDDEFTYPMQLEFFTGRLNRACRMYDYVDRLIQEWIEK